MTFNLKFWAYELFSAVPSILQNLWHVGRNVLPVARATSLSKCGTRVIFQVFDSWRLPVHICAAPFLPTGNKRPYFFKFQNASSRRMIFRHRLVEKAARHALGARAAFSNNNRPWHPSSSLGFCLVATWGLECGDVRDVRL